MDAKKNIKKFRIKELSVMEILKQVKQIKNEPTWFN